MEADDTFVNLARSTEAAIFKDEFGNVPDEWGRHCAPYDQRSLFLLAVRQYPDPMPIGVIRVIQGNALTDFPSYCDMSSRWGRETALAASDVVHGTTWDICSLGTEASIRESGLGQSVILAMLYSLYKLVRLNDVKWLMGILADRVLDSLVRFGFDIQSIGLSQDYWGVDSTPFVLEEERLPATMYAKNRFFAELLSNGFNERRSLADNFNFDARLVPTS
jgi:hypothetical protein